MASIQKAAAYTLRTAARPTLSTRLPALTRHQTAPAKVPEPVIPLTGIIATSTTNLPTPSANIIRDNPDYNVAVDYRTSNFSPIPTRVMDGSEPGETTPAAVLSGAPVELQARTVRIYRPAKPATQSGDWQHQHWRMDWDVLSKGHRWENPLMGWQSSADFMQGTHLTFKSKEDAILFASKQGYEYFVQEPNERRVIPKAYANQFVHIPGKMKQVRTK
ncbi:ndufs4 NADH dehydrogenase Fe-S protein subunit [Extremus antarcticus]|uniref:NADH dehydrogenase [ubiquinone] iron-sulfur protein 4, mitochondrial n=1 Tax=Extremus antarcticus TaxID=702011 RepID=A0AAJ0GCF9_9PEZI|nr:ndufs4 NADH dehydrogenase Fe-S protein subunit [Extremus antarcticus]